MSEKEIWDWFSQNNNRLTDLLNGKSTDYSAYNELSEMIQNYNKNLFPEITAHENKFVLIITCDGRRDGIAFVEKLCDAAPPIENWIIQKYRQPGHTTQLNFNGLEFGADDIHVEHRYSRGTYDIKVLIKNYDAGDSRYKSLAFLYLDHLVGEYNVMTKIDAIDFGVLDHGYNSIPLKEFAKLVTTQP